MSIVFACPECGNRLRVDNELSRKRVACPDCRALLTAPAGEEATPADALPVAEVVAPAPAAKLSPSHAVPPLSAPGPHKNEWSFDDADRPADGSESGLRLVRANGNRPGPAVEWAAFSSGCALVRVGVWVELAGLACLILAFDATLLGVLTKTDWLLVLKWGGPFTLVPYFALLIVGTTVTGTGRWRMLAIPPETGASGVFGGALGLTVVRLTGLVAALVFTAVICVEWRHNELAGAGRYAVLGLGATAVALLAGTVADLTAIPGMAVVGGAMPSTRLRQQAGWVSFVLQLVIVAWVVLVVLMYMQLVSAVVSAPARLPHQKRPAEPGAPAAPVPAGRPAGGLPIDLETVSIAAVVILTTILLVAVAYTYLHASLYAAGRRAAAGGDGYSR